ncbi:PREDICTED: RNA-directed DNA polymerase from mobile element jockey-like [Wasmannia auropunctata]|uniref:RNA-directed DNA polymerase from mobile element jockey-like n=1 Tax=Wasmannia auropunctata TaxID=64793 RepID=UPI0005EDCE40|nr:PREDICTED: RNA-directed DNA polymerase from mobile element jockey-like [Wasmannia auropunctata]
MGKLFERIIIQRIRHSVSTGVGLSPHQFGFRAQRSTVDALLRLRAILEPVYEGGRVGVAISLDISNAFNSFPWERIWQALVAKKVPNYLRTIVESYLSNRWICFEDAKGRVRKVPMTCGVPQGSAFGPEAWIFTYDEILKQIMPEEDCHVLCYADDTPIHSRDRGLFKDS